MSRKEFEASRMRRMRRVAGRHGLTILTAEKLTAKQGKGGHALRDDESFKVVYGHHPLPFTATLEDIEAYLDKLEAAED
ncbi:G5P family DNA-binding protein [Devosia lacusdianchii]|uniref:G5P family DNA-binding protein n=1 Tax=Devosia lacusdianchii TaxID=2917991 RepID=UPI001F05F780|nr:G5P family DNA-binding protein [Devosia sp. JXJ CY 41]